MRSHFALQNKTLSALAERGAGASSIHLGSQVDHSYMMDLYAVQFIIDLLPTESQGNLADEDIVFLLDCIRSSKSGRPYLDLSAATENEQEGISRSVQNLEQLGLISDDGNNTPLVEYRGRVYLQRIWRLQRSIDEWKDARESQSREALDQSEQILTPMLVNVFRALFELDQKSQIDWQAVAALQAMTQGYLVLTGGPGTGKTTTAARLLMCLVVQALGSTPSETRSSDIVTMPKVRFLAPTGKAAVKLCESITSIWPQLIQGLCESLGDAFDDLNLFELNVLPNQGETIHRALGIVGDDIQVKRSRPIDLDQFDPNRNRFAIDADILLIDEASMIDLALMEHLLREIPDSCKVVFMGDHEQLPPVEAGEVLHEWATDMSSVAYTEAQLKAFSICFSDKQLKQLSKEGNASVETPRHLCHLHHTYRFSGPIFDLAQCLTSWSVCDRTTLENLMPIEEGIRRFSVQEDLLSPVALTWLDVDRVRNGKSGELDINHYLEQMVQGYQPYFDVLEKHARRQGDITSKEIQELFTAKAQFQILGAMYEGPLGINALNQMLENRYFERISRLKLPNGELSELLYHGKVIMVTRNQPELQVFNGDLGIVLNRGGHAMVVFGDKVDTSGDNLEVPLHLIYQWQAAFAISVHKSQGSEYDRVAVVLPSHARDLINRRLLYTAVTRSQSEVELWLGLNLFESL